MNKDISTDHLPHKPGVYQFFSSKGELIYVGKAKDLQKRVSSYFNRHKYESAKLRVLVSKINQIKHIVVNTESDALLLENNLIKKHQPRYNILLKDDKTYPWICVMNEPFPRVFTTRRIQLNQGQYFGPYTSGVLLRTVIDLIRSLFPLRSCNLSLSKENIASGKYKPCLEYQIGNCLAPCIGNQSIDSYNKNIESIIKILKGNIHSVKAHLKETMIQLSKQQQFEEAQRYKDKLLALERYQAKSTIVSQNHKDIDVFSVYSQGNRFFINYIKIIKGAVIQSHNLELTQKLDETENEAIGLAIAELRQRFGNSASEILVSTLPDFALDGCKYIVPARGDKFKLLQLSQRNAKSFALEMQRQKEKKNPEIRIERVLSTIQTDFKTKELPIHIECFDNSNLQGTNPVASCVVFRKGKPAKKEYRIFNITTVEGPDDFASMHEVVTRRYKRLLLENVSLPQLIIIDGGKGQLSASYKALKALNIEHKVQIIGIAKRLEEIFFPGDPVPVYLDKNSESLKVIQYARNEAHRFAINHHRGKRSSQQTQSMLLDIPGIGDKTIHTLFKKYKNISSIKNASETDLIKVVGKSKAIKIREFFNSPKNNS